MMLEKSFLDRVKNVTLKIYLLQHLHLVAKKGGLVAEEVGLVGQQVADGGDRGGELGGGI